MFRQCSPNGMMSDKGMTYNTLLRGYDDLRWRADLLESGPLYGLRRGSANGLHGSFSVNRHSLS